MSLNRIVLIGRLTRDPEMKYTPQGLPVTTMRLAVNRITKDEQGQYESDFFDVVAWRRSAEYASNYLRKGQLISVEGRLQSRRWVDQATGQNRTAYEIVADNLQALERRMDGDPGSDGEMDGDPEARTAAPTRSAAPAPRPATPSAPPRQPARPIAPQDDIDETDPFADE